MERTNIDPTAAIAAEVARMKEHGGMRAADEAFATERREAGKPSVFDEGPVAIEGVAGAMPFTDRSTDAETIGMRPVEPGPTV